MKIFRFIIPLVILSAAGWKGKQWMDNRPEARRFPTSPTSTHVEASVLRPTKYQVIIESQGTVKARTESTLIPEVAGIVLKISPNFRDGGFFEAGELLLEIDPGDYETALTVAEAALTDARSNLDQEKALAEQALADWKRLGGKSEASALTLRKPQLAKAEAAMASATARVKDAQRDLQRTRIKAPYAGRILTKRVDIGQYVSPGIVLANIYAVDYAEIRLPLSNHQLAFLKIPESFRGDASERAEGPEVTLSAEVRGKSVEWRGKIVRAEGAVDTRSRQQFVIAQVDNPYGRRGPNHPPLKVGMYVEAKIKAETLDGVYVVPRSALRPNDEVLMVDAENRLHRKRVAIDWRDAVSVVVSESFKEGDLLCLTSLPFAAENALVVPNIDGKGPRYMEGQKPKAGGPGGKGKGKGKGGKSKDGAKDAAKKGKTS